MNMKWLKERSSLALTGAIFGIIICTLCVIFTEVIPAIVITTLSITMVGIMQEVQVYFSNKVYEFDWLNIYAILLGGLIAVLIVSCFALLAIN